MRGGGSGSYGRRRGGGWGEGIPDASRVGIGEGVPEPFANRGRSLQSNARKYSTTSRPFDPPTTGKIAIKMINHYGDEVLKVFSLAAL